MPKAVGTDYDKEVGERLRMALKASGLSNAELARRLGVSEPGVGHWIKGRASIPRQVIPKIFQVTRINADWLFLGDPSRLPADVREKLFPPAVRKAG